MNQARTIIPAALFACALAACGVGVPEDLKDNPKPNRDGKTAFCSVDAFEADLEHAQKVDGGWVIACGQRYYDADAIVEPGSGLLGAWVTPSDGPRYLDHTIVPDPREARKGAWVSCSWGEWPYEGSEEAVECPENHHAERRERTGTATLAYRHRVELHSDRSFLENRDRFDHPRHKAAPIVPPEERLPVDLAKYREGAHITDPPPSPSWQRPEEITSKYRAIMRSSSSDNELRKFFSELLEDERVGIDRSRTIREVKMKTGSAGDLSDVIVGGTKGETLGADGEILERLRDEIRGMRGE